MSKKLPLREVAHARTGEKGDLVNLAIIAYDESDYNLLREQVTVGALWEIYGPMLKGPIERFEVPNLGALNFVLHGALGGGRSRTLAFDESGKALSSRVLDLEIAVSENYASRSERERAGVVRRSQGDTIER